MSNLAIATGSVGIMGIVLIILFYTVGGIFGPMNDVANGLMAVLTAVLAWRLHPWHRGQAAGQSRGALAAAWLGALIAVAGSILVIFQFTGWFLAGLVTTFGYAFIGMWLVSVNGAAERSQAWPRRGAQLGRAAGASMMLGLLVGPGILRGVNSFAASPWWMTLGFLGGLGWFVALPLWCLWLGRRLARQETPRPEAERA